MTENCGILLEKQQSEIALLVKKEPRTVQQQNGKSVGNYTTLIKISLVLSK